MAKVTPPKAPKPPMTKSKASAITKQQSNASLVTESKKNTYDRRSSNGRRGLGTV